MKSIKKTISAILYFYTKSFKDIRKNLVNILKDKDEAFLTITYFIIYFSLIGFIFYFVINKNNIPIKYLIPITLLSILISLIFIIFELVFYNYENISSEDIGIESINMIEVKGEDNIIKYSTGGYLALIIYSLTILCILLLSYIYLGEHIGNILVLYTIILFLLHFIAFLIYITILIILYPLYEIIKNVFITINKYFKK